MLPVLEHPGGEISPGCNIEVDASCAGILGGDDGLSLALAARCASGPRRPYLNEVLVSFPGDAEQRLTITAWPGARKSLAADLALECGTEAAIWEKNFWMLDGDQHGYLFVVAGGYVRVFRDGTLVLERRSQPVYRRVWQKLVLGDDVDETDVLMAKAITNLRVWDGPVEWEEAFCGRRGKNDSLAIAAARLHRMWEQPRFTDAVVSAEGRSFPVHRAVLSESSPVLAAMFENEVMQEGKSRLVRLSNVPVATVEAFLQYMYSCELPAGCDIAPLLALADQYQVDGLVELCCLALFDETAGVSTEKAIEALEPIRHHDPAALAWCRLVERCNMSAVVRQAVV